MPACINQSLSLIILSLFSFQLIGLTIQNRPKLIILQQFIRHGGRYPSDAQELVKNSYPKEKSGYLTNKGSRMSFLLGKELNNMYWKKLFGNKRQLQKQKFRVRSTLFNRTIQTAQAHNLGLLENTLQPIFDQQSTINTQPPFTNSVYHSPQGPLFGSSNKKTQFLPINSVEYLFSKSYAGDFLAKHTQQACPKQKFWRANNLEGERYQYIFQDPRYIKTVRKLEKAFNRTVEGEYSLARYYSSIVSLKDLGVKLPPLCYQTSPDFNDLKIYSAINFYICNYSEELQLHILMAGIFAEITNNIREKTSLGESYPSWFIYTTHEEIIGGFLAILDLMNIDCMLNTLQSGEKSHGCEAQIPKFCSSIIFEFYEYSPSNRITFKIRFNGQYQMIRFCKDQYECDVNSLYSWFETWKVADVPKTCAEQ